MVLSHFVLRQHQYLISGAYGDTNTNVDHIAMYKSDEEYQLLMEYHNLNRSQKDKIEGYLRALIDAE